MRIRQWLVFVLLIAALASPCFAWGPDGHRIIGEIAARHLSDKTSATIKELLGDQSLADASNWADEIRKDARYDWAKPLHFINVPRGATKVNTERDCKEGQCVIAAIRKYEAILRDENLPREQRIEALKFLVHFVGDVHQPLHVSFEDDRGGNLVKLTWLDQPDWNLHRVWDAGLIERRIASDPAGRAAMSADIQQSINDRKLKQWRRSTDPIIWANESLTHTYKIYSQLPRNGKYDNSYYTRNIGTVEERLAMAGVRLAAMLNSIFDPAATSSSGSNGDKAGSKEEPVPALPADEPSDEKKPS